MTRILNQPLEWLGTKIGADRTFRSEVKVFRQKFSRWRYAQTNNADVWEHDPDLEVAKSAEKLTESDPEAAFAQLRALAERGSLWSMMLVGWAYYTGKGVVADQLQAEYWLQLASDGGCQQAQLRLGHILCKRREFDRCEQVYGIGVSANWPPAMYYLAYTKIRQPKTSKRLEEVRILLERAAAHGDIEAQIDLANLMARGRYGLRQVPAGILLLFKAATKAVAFINQNALGDDRTPVIGVSSTTKP